MLHEVFYWLLSMSISAVITGIFVLLVRNIKKIPKRITIILWLVPFIRMAIPVGLNGNHNLMSLISKITTRSIKVYQPTNHVSVSMMNMTTLADSYFPVTYGSVVLEKIFSISSIIWITVFIAIVLILAIIYFVISCGGVLVLNINNITYYAPLSHFNISQKTNIKNKTSEPLNFNLANP